MTEYSHYNSDVVEIIPNLWLSNYKKALDKQFLIQKKINIIINCSKDIKFINSSKFKKIRIPVDDNLKDDQIELLYNYFDTTSKIIFEGFKQQKGILVHCYAGKQRSASVIAAFLMNFLNIDWREGIALIQSKKPSSFRPGINFASALQKYANDKTSVQDK